MRHVFVIFILFLIVFALGCVTPNSTNTKKEVNVTQPTSITFVKASGTCTFSNAGFSCTPPEPKIYAVDDKVNLVVNVTNYQGQNVNIKKIFCTDLKPTEVDQNFGEDKIESLGNGDTKEFDVRCWKDKVNSDQILIAPGSEFAGYLYVWYLFDNDPKTSRYRLAPASITGIVREK